MQGDNDEVVATECRYCGYRTKPDEFGLCDGCFYGMRLVPKQWRAGLAARGRPVAATGVREATGLETSECERIPGGNRAE